MARKVGIFDEFTDLPISNNQKYLLRRVKKGLCRVCGKKRFTSYYCAEHAKMDSERVLRKYNEN